MFPEGDYGSKKWVGERDRRLRAHIENYKSQ